MTRNQGEFSRDEVRRQLLESQREHEAALPLFGEALSRTFDPDASTTSATKAALLGLPDRRGFLRIGGATIAFSAVLAACGHSTKKQTPIGGTTPPTTEAGTQAAPAGSPELDVSLLRTAQSIEVLAVNTYQTALDSGLLTTPSVSDSITLFQAQHRDHAGLLARATQDAGGQVYDQPNPFLSTTIVDPAVQALTDEKGVVDLAVELENTAAQTYVYASELLTTAALRQAIMSIGGVEARHIAVLFGVQGQPQAPFPFMPRRAHIDAKGIIPPGDVTAPSTSAPAATTSTKATSTTTTVGSTTTTKVS